MPRKFASFVFRFRYTETIDFELLHEWFPEDQYTWLRKGFAKAASAKKGEKQNMGEELLIMNY